MKAEQPVPSFPPDTADKNSLTCQSKIQDGEDEVAPESKRETLNLEADQGLSIKRIVPTAKAVPRWFYTRLQKTEYPTFPIFSRVNDGSIPLASCDANGFVIITKECETETRALKYGQVTITFLGAKKLKKNKYQGQNGRPWASVVPGTLQAWPESVQGSM